MSFDDHGIKVELFPSRFFIEISQQMFGAHIRKSSVAGIFSKKSDCSHSDKPLLPLDSEIVVRGTHFHRAF